MATYAVPEDKLTAIADAIRLKRDTTTDMTLDDMALQIGLISGGGSTLPLTLELIGEETKYLEEYANNTTTQNTDFDIDIQNSDYGFIIITITCDGQLTGLSNEWGGISIAFGGRYANGNFSGSGHAITYQGIKTINFRTAKKAATKSNDYGVFVHANQPKVLIQRRATTNCPRIMGGNYTVRAYGVSAIDGYTL